MTIDINAIRARVEAATPGPWRHDHSEIYSRDLSLISDGDVNGNWVAETAKDDDARTEADAEFIAHTRTDVPALLALVDEQAAEIARLRAVADAAQAFVAASRTAPNENPDYVQAELDALYEAVRAYDEATR